MHRLPPKAAQPAVLPRTHEAFFQQDKSLLLRYLRNTYSLTPDALKDMSLILSHAALDCAGRHGFEKSRFCADGRIAGA